LSKISAVPVKYIPFKKAHDIKLKLGHAPVLDLPFQVRIKLKLQVFNQTSGETEESFQKKISELEPAITKNRSSDSIMFHPQNKLFIEHDE